MTSLRSTVLAATSVAFAAAGDLLQDVTIRRTPAPTYNPTTGLNTPGTPVDYTVEGMVGSYKQFEVDGTLVKSTDRKIMVQQAALAISPTTSDKAVVGGVALSILNVGQDAAGATWTLQARA